MSELQQNECIHKMISKIDHETIHNELVDILIDQFSDQFDKMFEEKHDDFSIGFVAFVEPYFFLSRLINLEYTIYDLGCYHACQAWFFRNHHKYVGVDAGIEHKLSLKNTEHHFCTIGEFVKTNPIDKKHFAICNCVPPWHGDDPGAVTKEYFDNLYVYYP